MWQGSPWTLPGYPPWSSASVPAWKAEPEACNFWWKTIELNRL